MFPPKLLKAEFCDNVYSERLETRVVKDYEFDYYFDVGRQMQLNGKWYCPDNGTIIIRKPGDLTMGTGFFHCYMVTVDFQGNTPVEDYDRNLPGTEQKICDYDEINILPSSIIIYHNHDIIDILQKLYYNHISNTPKSFMNKDTQRLLGEFLHLLLSDYYHTSITSGSHIKFRQVCTYIQTHYDSKISLNDLADIAHMDRSYFVRAFKKEMNTTPMAFLDITRIENAKRRLLDTDNKVSEISSLSGYTNVAYFCAHFKKLTGITPSEYRNLSKSTSSYENKEAKKS